MSEEAHFRCEQCQKDLEEFQSRPENRLPEDIDYDDPVATKELERLMHQIQEREQVFMRQKLANRKGPDHAA